MCLQDPSEAKKMLSTPNWELKVIGGWEPLDTDAENSNASPLARAAYASSPCLGLLIIRLGS